MFSGFHHSLEGADGPATNFPTFVVVVVIIIIVFLLILIVLVFILVLFFCLFFLFVFSIVAIAVIRIVTHVRQGRLDNLLQVMFHFIGATHNKGFKTHETGLSQFIGQCNGSFVIFAHSTHGFVLIVNVLIVASHGIFRVGEPQKDGNNLINLLLSKTMPNSTGDGAHGSDQGTCVVDGCFLIVAAVFPEPLAGSLSQADRSFNQIQQGLHHAHQERITQDDRQAGQCISRSFAHNGRGSVGTRRPCYSSRGGRSTQLCQAHL
mmetsp:Transcript_27176/g.74934  ORF Transcript_27176/g.74934 Transcript_27176/m.74934 type:complete len:263 (-) Transcript_27176:312-1100(-)